MPTHLQARTSCLPTDSRCRSLCSDGVPILTYEAAVERGKSLVDMIDVHPTLPEQSSRWQLYPELEEQGWEQVAKNNSGLASQVSGSHYFNEAWNVKTDYPNNINIKWEHNALTEAYPTFFAHYDHTFNVAAGTIFVKNIQSPAANTVGNRAKVPTKELPALSRWSDVTYLQWAKLTDPASLKRVLHCDIQNEHTRSIINRVMGNDGDRPPTLLEFPDRSIYTQSDGDDFKALLGTPNGLGTAWMLAQHKGENQLGWKCVESISLFNADPNTGENDYMVIEVGKHPDEEQSI